MKLTLISILFIFTAVGWSTPAKAETTLPFLQEVINAGGRYDDRTCPGTANHPRYRRLCCHSGIRYRCNFLYDQFRNNRCRPSVRARRWQRCRNLPNLDSVTEAEVADEPSRPVGTYPLMRPTGALSYAADLTACASFGRRRAGGANYCARGVRHALACLARRQGRQVDNYYLHCGGSAYNYWGEGCLERRGFVNMINRDRNMCNRPGVVRVYWGGNHRQRGHSGGDYHGHIEFLGTDGMWHAGASSSLPIDQRLGRNRRRLKACYVLPEGRIQ